MGRKKGQGRYDCMSQTEGEGENMHIQRAKNTVLMRDPKDRKREATRRCLIIVRQDQRAGAMGKCWG